MEIFLLYGGPSYESFQDGYEPSLAPLNSGAAPPSGLLEPAIGFGKVWRWQPGVRERVGWGKASEVSGAEGFEMLTGGYVLWISQTNQADVFVFSPAGNSVRAFDVPFSAK